MYILYSNTSNNRSEYKYSGDNEGVVVETKIVFSVIPTILSICMFVASVFIGYYMYDKTDEMRLDIYSQNLKNYSFFTEKEEQKDVQENANDGIELYIIPGLNGF